MGRDLQTRLASSCEVALRKRRRRPALPAHSTSFATIAGQSYQLGIVPLLEPAERAHGDLLEMEAVRKKAVVSLNADHFQIWRQDPASMSSSP